MVKEQTKYGEILEDIRHIYKQKYGVAMDDELLYLIIRMNELQVAVNKKIEDIPRVTYPTGRDYFLYSMGKYVSFFFLAIAFFILSAVIFFYKNNENRYQVIRDQKGTIITLIGFSASGDTTIRWPAARTGVLEIMGRNKK